MPFLVEFEDKVERGTRRGRRFFVVGAGLRPAVVHRLRKICTEVHVSVLILPRANSTGETVGMRYVVEKPIAEVGVLCSRAAEHVEDIAVERPGAKSLGRSKSEQPVQAPLPGWNSASKS